MAAPERELMTCVVKKDRMRFRQQVVHLRLTVARRCAVKRSMIKRNARRRVTWWDCENHLRTACGFIVPMGTGGDGQEKLTYYVEVINKGAVDESNVVLTIETPTGTTFANSLNPPLIRINRTSSDKRTVDFLPLATLRPQESAKFRVVVNRLRNPVGAFRAKVTSDRRVEGRVFSDHAP